MRSALGKKIRQEAKAHTFKPLYGGESGTENEQEYYRAFKTKYKGITDMQTRWKDEVLKTKQLRTITGLIFYWPDTHITRSGYITNTTAICNYPVQMFATADIMPIAVRCLWQRLRSSKMKAFLVNTIHDSAIGEVPDDEIEQYKLYAEEAFNKDSIEFIEKLYGIEINLAFDSEHKISSHWGSD